ncbi:hypothetical protein BCON_0352g00040 [Botryotinia convoluta]|uniref:Methyltransferase type 11 domain-containing protein n=1 Tax=Botryotinia convoluta TaxID=54673 RepID=A0A4Z1HA08_9HELO|nr:hypothetical protein BCON_0352g00040 [Botryotinia convoluta]
MSETQTVPVKEPFVPKQMMAKTAALYKELTGDSSTDAAKHAITHLLSPFTADAISKNISFLDIPTPKIHIKRSLNLNLVHDNGCITGEVTKAIMEFHPPDGIIIQATDRNQYMIDSCRDFATAGNWPVEATVMPAQSLTFPDNHFTHSFSNFFVSHLDENHDPAAKQAAMAHGEPIERAHLETRGPGVPFPMAMPTHWYGKDALRNFYLVGGFKENNINITTCDVYIEAKNLRHLMSATWSFLGARADGWDPEDEENWDKAVDILVEDIEAGPYYSKLPSGNIALRMVANVGLATK